MIVPLLDLVTTDGKPAPWKEIWQRKNLLLLLGEAGCEECLSVLEGWIPRLQEEEAAAVAIFPVPPERTPEGAVYLLDPEGRMAAFLGVPQGTAVAADRYFAVQAVESIHALGAKSVTEDTLSWIDLAERVCDECGAPVW